MGTLDPKRVELAAEDRARMQRLSEEVRGRIEEMSGLSARVLGLRLTPEMKRKFVMKERRGASASRVVELELIDIPTDPPSQACIVVDDTGRWFLEYPCGG